MVWFALYNGTYEPECSGLIKRTHCTDSYRWQSYVRNPNGSCFLHIRSKICDRCTGCLYNEPCLPRRWMWKAVFCLPYYTKNYGGYYTVYQARRRMTDEYRKSLAIALSDYKKYGSRRGYGYHSGNAFVHHILKYESPYSDSLWLDRHTHYVPYISPYEVKMLKHVADNPVSIEYFFWRYINPYCSNWRIMKFILKGYSTEYGLDVETIMRLCGNRLNMWDMISYFVKK